MNKCREKIKVLILGPKMTPFPNFGHNIFLKIIKNYFHPLCNAIHLVQIQKNVINRFTWKAKTVDFGPRNDSISHFGHNKNFYFNACLQVQFQENLMKRFREKFKCWFWIKKCTISPILREWLIKVTNLIGQPELHCFIWVLKKSHCN